MRFELVVTFHVLDDIAMLLWGNTTGGSPSRWMQCLVLQVRRGLLTHPSGQTLWSEELYIESEGLNGVHAILLPAYTHQDPCTFMMGIAFPKIDIFVVTDPP